MASSNQFTRRCLELTALLALSGTCPAAEMTGTPPLSGTDIIRRLIDADNARRAALDHYSAHRRYSAGNKTSGKSAELEVAESSTQSKKQLKVLAARGSSLIVHRVLEKAIEAEMDLTREANLRQARLTPDNYKFQLNAPEAVDGRDCYVFSVTPKASTKYLIRGKIWVDKTDFAVVRVEGSPAKNPSFWTRKSHFVRRYEKHGQFWLPATFDSDAELLIFGKSVLRIEYTNYRINPRD